jgi:hypothetical protein
MSATEGGGLGAVQHLGSIEGGMEGAMHLVACTCEGDEDDNCLMIND